MAREEIARYCEELQNVNDSKRQSYLQPAQIEPFESYSGYVYTREWNISKLTITS
ncbi:MAG: hypothetical protein Q4E68_00605 [Prevotellaceae bacterium]|nr:hypothetical protein [Prevotellaceae bacterium]